MLNAVASNPSDCNFSHWWRMLLFLSKFGRTISLCVSRSLSTPAADAYDQLHAATSSSQPQKVCYGPRSFAVAGPATWNSLPASLRDDLLSVAAFRRLLKTELFARAYDSTLARSWLLLTVRVGEHNFNYTTTTTISLKWMELEGRTDEMCC